MAMLSSCTTLLSRAPPAPGKSSPASALQLRSRQPAAASVAALRWASRKESRSRAALFACHAQKYNIEPSALVHPRAFDGSDWSLGEEKNRIILSLNVGESTTEKDLEVATTEDQTLLVIRYNKEDKSSSSSPASSLDVRLLMPPGYDSNKMQAIMWNTGWLEISIPKPKHERKTIPITPSTKTQTTPTS
ncbi:unnamed protein product [Miscanthus lutarioriparius]|uniref:SHSP domain-containing protein n=1 Tax=Miscanthus lutarioriparius TaxID=422564 RepID=A0A811QPE5_9POAL|nr:unnamed protein product [Miscanthus lutarioriparius]